MSSRVYFDFNASAPLLDEARNAMIEAFDIVGNASSVHSEGRRAYGLLDSARADLAQTLAVSPSAITFTSGASEAAALALTPHFATKSDKRPCGRLLRAEVEHPCVRLGHRFAQNQQRSIAVDQNGIIDFDDLDAALRENPHERPMLALQLANNETGVIQPVAEAAAKVHEAGGVVVCDAVQGFGRLDVNPTRLGVDALFVTAHKIGGPKGVGALVLEPACQIDRPLMVGGGQERGLRAGTENIQAIVGFAAAALASIAVREKEVNRLKVLRDLLESKLSEIQKLQPFCQQVPRLANTSAFGVADIESSALLIAMDLRGFAISAGSACSSGKVKASGTLQAMKIDDSLIAGAMRVSLGRSSMREDVLRFCHGFSDVVENMRKRRQALAN